MDLNKIPKQFCENITVAFSEETFFMGMLNGESATFYALTPQHMKRLSQYLASQVGEYEKKFGAIDAEWSPGVESPMQKDDLSQGSS